MNNNRNVSTFSPFITYCQHVIPLAYDESMSYYETLCALRDYLVNTVIPAVNNNANAVTELQNAFETLQNYIDNYFKNLDVQTEINNKLDEMVTDGTLANIINEQIFNDLNEKINNKITVIDTVTDLKSYNGVNGELVQTKGYYSVNDRGKALYLLTNDENTTVNDLDILSLTNGLKAVQLYTDTLNVLTCGAKGDNTFDNAEILQNIINYCQTNGKQIYIPYGKYYLSKGLKITKKLTIFGDELPFLWNTETESNSDNCTELFCKDLNSEPLITIAMNGVPYFWNDGSKLVNMVNLKNLRLMGKNRDVTPYTYSLTGIWNASYRSKFENIVIWGFQNGMTCSYNYYNIFEFVDIHDTYQALVMYNTNQSMKFNNCWIGSINDDSGVNEITNQTYKNNYPKITDFHYTCLFSNYAQASFYNCAFEGSNYYAIYNLDSTLTMEQIDIESIKNTFLYVASNISYGCTKINNLSIYNPSGSNANFCDVHYHAKLIAEFDQNLPSIFNDSSYKIADGGIANITSRLDGNRVIPITINNITNPTFVNKSYYTNRGVHVDITITNWDTWNESNLAKITLPRVYQTLNHYFTYCSREDDSIHGLRINNGGNSNSFGILKTIGSYSDMSNYTTKPQIQIVFDYDIINW